MHLHDDTRARVPAFHYQDFDARDLARIKKSKNVNQTITVGLPAKNESSTIGEIVEQIHSELVQEHGLVDELLVLDDYSSDDTAAVARLAGATVYQSRHVHPEFNRVVDGVPQGGKGEALWKLLRVSTGDIIVWCDADIRNFDTRFILGCLGPLLANPDTGFIKGFYQRPVEDDDEGGGRVTELVARPLISTLFPHLGHFVQPLSGEFGGRRSIVEAVPFSRGYAVDLALLVDISDKFGAGIIDQVDLGTRVHRNRPLRELGPQAAAIIAMAHQKSGIDIGNDHLDLLRPTIGDHRIQLGELPSISSLRDQPVSKAG